MSEQPLLVIGHKCRVGRKAQGLRLEDFYELLWGKPAESVTKLLSQAMYGLKTRVCLFGRGWEKDAFGDRAYLVRLELQDEPQEESEGSISYWNSCVTYLDDVSSPLLRAPNKMSSTV